ncbi:hypothetical protein ACFWIY_17545 [Streptomyces sioyaensis]|uniref:hypothetical protein n=1 Tax=Streptomyces sioyaensis TaxID=67364 RepID=UPI0036556979
MTELVAALADHRRAMWLREEARPAGGARREARAASHATRAAITTPPSASPSCSPPRPAPPRPPRRHLRHTQRRRPRRPRHARAHAHNTVEGHVTAAGELLGAT